MEVPVIRRANKPFLDETGFWIDLDLTYNGKFKMTIETKVNLLKLKTTKTRPEHTDDEQRYRHDVFSSFSQRLDEPIMIV